MCEKERFWAGFYLTTSKEQTKSFLKTSIAKARANGQISEDQNYGYIYVFEINLFNQLQTHIFNSADINWLHCVAAHRKKKLFADDFCIKQLSPNKLKDQYCFKTEAAIACLKFVESEKIWLK